MLKYKIKADNPLSHYLQIELQFAFDKSGPFELVIPAWRPGRYEVADYEKNIRDFKIVNDEGKAVIFQKTAKNVWCIDSKSGFFTVSYSYFAFQPDAGASYIDDELWILNLLSFLIYPDGLQTTPCSMELALPEGWQAATTQIKNNDQYEAKDYFELTDRPIIAARGIQSYSYKINEIPFHLWIYGKAPVNLEDLIPSFSAFSKEQLEMFDSCPFEKYAFLIVVLPFRFYHGVEHADNTMIVLGIDDGADPQTFIDDLLGVSSHELFHTWNIKKIRPKELQPYNFKDYILFKTGMIAEGFTTYYGDLFLVRSGVWTIERYLQELNIFIKRHFHNPGRLYASLADSSENLWIDGYKPGAPFHKVSIYVKGAIVAMMLDMKIRLNTENKHSLDDLMRMLDAQFVTTGYSLDDIRKCAENLAGEDMEQFFTDYAYGITPVEDELIRLAGKFGLKVIVQENHNAFESYFGITASFKDVQLVVENVIEDSPAEKALAVGDRILTINNKKINTNWAEYNDDEILLKIIRLGRPLEIKLNRSNEVFSSYFQLQLNANRSEKEDLRLKKWLSP